MASASLPFPAPNAFWAVLAAFLGKKTIPFFRLIPWENGKYQTISLQRSRDTGLNPPAPTMHINYILLAHQHPLQIARLVKALTTPNTFFYIHIDQKINDEPFRQALAGHKACHWLQSRQRCTWGDSSIVKASLAALQVVVAEKKEGYCVLLSGQDYPLRSNNEIEAYLQKREGTCFIETYPMPHERWPDSRERLYHYKFDLSTEKGHSLLIPSLFSKDFYTDFGKHARNCWLLLAIKKTLPLVLFKKRKFPPYCKPYGGSQWWAIPVEMAAAILDFLRRHPGYLPYFNHSLVPDETFFHTIIMHLLKERGQQPADPITYADWGRQDVPLPVTFTSVDCVHLQNQPEGMLLARKFDETVDTEILDCIDKQLRVRGEKLTTADESLG